MKQNMATVVIDIDDKSNIEKVMEALSLFKGVKRVSLEENLNYPKLNKSISEQKTGKTVRSKNMTELMQKLKS
jgi:hypothetical protein